VQRNQQPQNHKLLNQKLQTRPHSWTLKKPRSGLPELSGCKQPVKRAIQQDNIAKPADVDEEEEEEKEA